jgi:hypothetical protein
MRRVEPERVAEALGATIEITEAMTPQSPIALVAMRQELLSRLTSTGGRPGLAGATRRQKIPLDDADWARLQKIAEALNDEEVKPTPGQVASVLLHRVLVTLDLKSAASELRSEIGSRATEAND